MTSARIQSNREESNQNKPTQLKTFTNFHLKFEPFEFYIYFYIIYNLFLSYYK